MLDKHFDAATMERKHYEIWEKSGAFTASPSHNGAAWSIMIPPPNVTGSLHMGHALNNTLQDILTRWHRLKGDNTLWQPGTDHAGIATQMVVERNLAKEGISRHDLGREAFINRVWQWKEESGNTITGQLRRLGASPDWSRERFTMDEGMSAAVRKAFVTLYRDGLIYRAKRLVNWDVKLFTAISDLEVVQQDVKGSLWHFNYPLADGNGHITIATTRPETMLGDVAVAVNPKDPRFKHLIGQNVILPLVGRLIPVIGDDYADMEMGTGALKITPAHDFNDFAVGQRHGLDAINILNPDGTLNDTVPESYRGMERFAARKQIVADMEALGLLDKIEPHAHKVPHGDRSGVVVEPLLTDQWYVNAEVLAQPALAAVRQGKTVFHPKQWENTYYQWLENIQPWCISRQIWWGHQIPAWYDADGNIYVAETETEAKAQAGGKPLRRDEDVLDTWFSSALWPFSTLGWPDKTADLERYYPTSTLITGFDIIFFWVARMMMMGLHFTGQVPFKDVYIHALVRDETGAKMSKSKGNVIDPLGLVDDYGADALRFTLTAMAAQGRDIKLSLPRVEGYRNFCTKLWNAARYCEMNGATFDGLDVTTIAQPVNRWILAELNQVLQHVNAGLEAYKFNDVANSLYHFAWGLFCDWYLEFTKPILQGEDAAAIVETRAVTGFVLNRLLVLLHPVMPFITEELFQHFNGNDQSIAAQSWPVALNLVESTASADMNWVIRLISAIRSLRTDMNVPAAAKCHLLLKDANAVTASRLQTHRALILRMARLESAEISHAELPSGAVQALLDEATLVLPLAGLIDLVAERSRLEKEIAKIQSDLAKITAKLSNPEFVAKAPDEVIEEQKERQSDAEIALAKLTGALESVKAA